MSLFLLSTLNGLLVGLALEELRINHLRYIMDKAQRVEHANVVADFFEPHREFVVPLVCIITFPVVSYLIHRYLRNRPHTLLLVWIVFSAVALWVGYFMATRSADVFSFLWLLAIAIVSYSAHWLWMKNVTSVVLLWLVIGISSLVVIAFGVQLIGVFFYWPEPEKSIDVAGVSWDCIGNKFDLWNSRATSFQGRSD